MLDLWIGHKLKIVVALVLSAVGCVLLSALPGGAVAASSSGNDSCGYAASSFTESTVMRGAQIVGSGQSAALAAYANDEKGLLLGTNGATPNTSNPQAVNNPSLGDATAKDTSGRPIYPALYITNVSGNAGSTAGDFQHGGTPANLNNGTPFADAVFGTWSTGSGNPANNTYQLSTPPAGNNAGNNSWNLGPGSDTPGPNVDQSNSQNNSTEVRWNVSELGLQPGNTYRIQVIEHDGDQNKSGGDAGEFCVTLTIPGIQTTATTGTTVGQPVSDTATLKGSGGASGTITWNVYKSSDTTCSTSLASVTKSASGDGTYTSPSFTPTSAGSYQWVAGFSGSNPTVNITSACNTASEVSVVNKATPQFSTQAVNGTAGQPVHDFAIVGGGFNPGGTITWNVYAANDAGCSNSLFTSSAVTVNGDGTYQSPDFTPANSGNYQWVAVYSGDANNTSQSSGCGNEPFTVQQAPAPAIKVIKLESFSSTSGFSAGPITGNVGQTVYYQMDVINSGNTTLVISFSDPGCDSGTLSGPTVPSGTFDSNTNTLSSGGDLRWTCSHVLTAADVSGYTNTASATGTSPQGQKVTGQSSVVAFSNTPGMQVVKLQRDGSTGSFTTSQLTGTVGDTINYEIQVTNSGNVPLTLAISDPHCDAGTLSGPSSISGTLTGNVLAAGGVAQYTCSHLLAAADIPQFTNVGTITGTPPSGPPLTGTGIVVVNVTQAAIKVVKLQSLSASGPFTTSTITARAGQKIYYEIQATNSGNAPLTLAISDPMCDAGTLQGPAALSGTLSAGVLSAGGEAQYTCTHVLTANDANPFTNTATVTGTPPSGPPVSGTSSVTAKKAAVKPITIKRCPRGTVKRFKKTKGGKKHAVCVSITHPPKRISGFTG